MYIRAMALGLFCLSAYLVWAQTDTTKLIVKPHQTTSQNSSRFFVVIDPGHGGKDPGKPRSNPKFKHEKDLSLAVALKLGELIEKKLKKAQVHYTRTSDEFVSLDDRVKIANDSIADVFISIHFNSNPVRKVYGAYCHIYSYKQPASLKLAQLIEQELIKIGRKSNGILDATKRGYNLQVLQYTEMPAVLVECAFLSNPEEEKYANSVKGQSELATAIFRGLKKFLAKPIPHDGRDIYYKVQVAASPVPLPANHPTFKKLKGLRIDEHEIPGRKYKYIYTVGREYDKELIDQLCQKIRKKGYKDAFVVKFEVQ